MASEGYLEWVLSLRAQAGQVSTGKTQRSHILHELVKVRHPVPHLVVELTNPNFPSIFPPKLKTNNAFTDSIMQFFKQMTMEWVLG